MQKNYDELSAIVEENDRRGGNNGNQERNFPFMVNERLAIAMPESGNVADLLQVHPAQVIGEGDNARRIGAWSGVILADGRGEISVQRLVGYPNSLQLPNGQPALEGKTRNERLTRLLMLVQQGRVNFTFTADKEIRGRHYSEFQINGAVPTEVPTENTEAAAAAH